MKKTVLSLVLSSAVLSAGAAHAAGGEFDGYFFGGKFGFNSSDVEGTPSASRETAATVGIEQGYNWQMGSFLVGGDFFADFNQKKDRTNVSSRLGSNAFGLDLKLGMPVAQGQGLPYVKLGWARVTGTGTFVPAGTFQKEDGVHWGIGYEHKLTPSWSIATELTGYEVDNAGSEFDNKNLTIGLNYYFGHVAAPVPAPAPKVVAPPPAPKPVAKPVPQPKESWKVMLEEKPVTIEGANFEFDSAKLRPSAQQRLKEVVNFAGNYKDSRLDVSGHTDSIGSDAYNQKLSEKRAAAVKQFLVEHGVASGRIDTVGYGEAKPIADNKTAEGRAQNRRVEIRSVIVEEKKVRVTE